MLKQGQHGIDREEASKATAKYIANIWILGFWQQGINRLHQFQELGVSMQNRKFK